MLKWIKELFADTEVVKEQSETITRLRQEILRLNNQLDVAYRQRDDLVVELTKAQDCFDTIIDSINSLKGNNEHSS